jgi:hypothetical protein
VFSFEARAIRGVGGSVGASAGVWLDAALALRELTVDL